jgi:hypothetical protein
MGLNQECKALNLTVLQLLSWYMSPHQDCFNTVSAKSLVPNRDSMMDGCLLKQDCLHEIICIISLHHHYAATPFDPAN